MIKEFAMIISIILFHELGHLIASRIYNWNLDKIAIYPFGGCVKFDEKVNRKTKEELIILISGPLAQIIYFIIVSFLAQKGIMTYRNYQIFENYHYTLLVFNLLPIYPLDGGRILNLSLNNYLPYKKSNKLASIISIIIILLMIPIYKSLNFTLMALLLLIEIINYLKMQPYLYNKMLLERYINRYKFNKLKIIKNKNSMYKNKRHIILHDNKYITEKQYLNKRFKVK